MYISNDTIGLQDAYRTRLIEITKLGNEFVESVIQEILDEVKDLLEHLKKAQPNLKPLVEYFVTEFTQLKNELNIDTAQFKKIEDQL